MRPSLKLTPKALRFLQYVSDIEISNILYFQAVLQIFLMNFHPQESDKSSRSGAPAATVAAFRCAMCGGQAGSAGEYQIHLFGRHEMLWCRPCDFRHHEDGMANHFRFEKQQRTSSKTFCPFKD